LVHKWSLKVKMTTLGNKTEIDAVVMASNEMIRIEANKRYYRRLKKRLTLNNVDVVTMGSQNLIFLITILI
jgi:hypothetical protein